MNSVKIVEVRRGELNPRPKTCRSGHYTPSPRFPARFRTPREGQPLEVSGHRPTGELRLPSPLKLSLGPRSWANRG